jgi:hypothetical protein
VREHSKKDWHKSSDCCVENGPVLSVGNPREDINDGLLPTCIRARTENVVLHFFYTVHVVVHSYIKKCETVWKAKNSLSGRNMFPEINLNIERQSPFIEMPGSL